MRDFFKSTGFSLLELMIALGVGSVVTLGVMGTFKQKSTQDRAIKRDVDISAASSYLNTVFTNPATFKSVLVDITRSCGNANECTPNAVLNGSGIPLGTNRVLRAGSTFGTVTVGNIVLERIKPLASSGNANGTKPGLAVIRGTFTPTVKGTKVLGAIRAKTTIIKLMVGLDNLNTIQGFISDTDTRTISLAQSCGNITGSDSNWSSSPIDMRILDPYDNDPSNGLTELMINSAKGKCEHEFFKQTCEDFYRAGQVNPYDGEETERTRYDDDEAAPWNERCVNAKEVICVALGKRWIDGVCYDTCIAEGIECGIKAPGMNSCGRCCARPSCCNGDPKCLPENGATCECNYCGSTDTCSVLAGTPPAAPTAPTTPTAAPTAPPCTPTRNCAEARANACIGQDAGSDGCGVSCGVGELGPACADPGGVCSGDEIASTSGCGTCPGGEMTCGSPPPPTCTPFQENCLYESLSPQLICRGFLTEGIKIEECRTTSDLFASGDCSCESTDNGAAIIYQGDGCDSACTPVTLTGGSTDGSTASTSTGGSTCTPNAVCDSSADCGGSTCAIPVNPVCLRYGNVTLGNCSMVDPAKDMQAECATANNTSCSCDNGGGSVNTPACLASAAQESVSNGHFQILYVPQVKTCRCD